MDELPLFVFAGIVWLSFIVVGVIGKPIRLSPVISIGGGFLAACISLILGKLVQSLWHIFSEGGLIALVVVLIAMWLMWGLMEKLFGR